MESILTDESERAGHEELNVRREHDGRAWREVACEEVDCVEEAWVGGVGVVWGECELGEECGEGLVEVECEGGGEEDGEAGSMNKVRTSPVS